MTTETQLFVYGTLKKEQLNGDMLTRMGGELQGEAILEGSYALFDMGWFPGATLANKADDLPKEYAVRGELWKIPEKAFSVLDRIEGVPHFFTRKKARVYQSTVLAPGQRPVLSYTKAYVYLIPREFVQQCTLIPDGVWQRPKKTECADANCC